MTEEENTVENTVENTEAISIRFGETKIEATGIVMDVLVSGDLIPHKNGMMMAIRLEEWVWSPAENSAIFYGQSRVLAKVNG